MPCMSYESNWASDSNDRDIKRLKSEADKLARIACKAMTELVKSGHADFLVLKDDEVREWWDKHQEDDRKAQEAKAERARRAKLKKDALAKLSDEEKKILGIK
jgi:cytosine/adenosine deaminase-related metal-dependent hydrolase